MKIKIIASTKIGYELPKEEAIDFSGKSAGICYLPDTMEKLFDESSEKTYKRASGTLKSGHHSVFGHPNYNLSLEGIPKILAIVLNNEKMYNTSEKSARYTKLAQENARYLISVFTPATTMEYTTNFAQLNYIIHFCENFINDDTKNTQFDQKLKNVFKEFIQEMPDLKVEELNADMKKRKLSLFAQRENRKEEFGENYCTTYLATFSEFAQAQRHRTLCYEISLLDAPQFYVPPIIKGTPLEEEWLKDIESLQDNFPQGMLIKINERGTVENFVLKCTER